MSSGTRGPRLDELLLHDGEGFGQYDRLQRIARPNRYSFFFLFSWQPQVSHMIRRPPAGLIPRAFIKR